MASSISGKSSQPSHNFDLPQIKWNKEGNSTSQHHRCRRSIKKSPPFSPSAASLTSVGSAGHSDPAQILEKAEKKLKGLAANEMEAGSKDSKGLINIPCKGKFKLKSEDEIPNEEQQKMKVKIDDTTTVKSASKVNKGKSCGGGGEAGGKKAKRKTSFSISLTKLEIEEDIFSLTCSRASRKPRKRPKNIQKQLDFVFPGLRLVPES